MLLLTQRPRIEGESQPAVFEGAKGGDYLTDVRKYAKRGRAAIEFPEVRIELRVGGAAEFELFTGTAPGIPSSLSSGPDSPVPECYPVIVRVRTNALRVHADWKFL